MAGDFHAVHKDAGAVGGGAEADGHVAAVPLAGHEEVGLVPEVAAVLTALTTIPTCIATFLAISLLATRLGQKKAMVIGSVGGIITNLALGALWLFGDPTTMTSNPATGAFHWGSFLILHLVLTIIQGGFQGISGNIVIPMTAGLVFAACGFTDHNPVMGDVATTQLRPGVVFLAYGIIILGLICNLIAMKFYPLTKEKMAELQNEIVAIKERTMAENQA